MGELVLRHLSGAMLTYSPVDGEGIAKIAIRIEHGLTGRGPGRDSYDGIYPPLSFCFSEKKKKVPLFDQRRVKW